MRKKDKFDLPIQNHLLSAESAKNFHKLLSVEISWIINMVYLRIGIQTDSKTNRQTAAVLHKTATFHTSI